MEQLNVRNRIPQIYLVTIYFCLLIIYVIPISSKLNLSVSDHGDIYYYLRLGIIPLGFLGLLQFHTRTKVEIAEYLSLITLALLSFFVNEEIPTTSILLLAGIIVYDNSISRRVEVFGEQQPKIKIISALFIVQLLIMLIVFYRTNGYIGIVSTCKDPNYTSYFLIIMYFMLGQESDYRRLQKRDIILLAIILTFSRTGMIAVVAIYLLRWTKFQIGKILKRPLIAFFIVLVVWVAISKGYVSFFEDYNYVYEYRYGLSRFTSFIDNSNYIRTIMNVRLVEDFNIKNILFGYTDAAYKTLIYFEGKTANPHNLFFAIYVQSGAIYAFAIVRRFAGLFQGKTHLMNMYFIMLIFAMMLGPSIYYGVDLLLILIAVKMQEE